MPFFRFLFLSSTLVASDVFCCFPASIASRSPLLDDQLPERGSDRRLSEGLVRHSQEGLKDPKHAPPSADELLTLRAGTLPLIPPRSAGPWRKSWLWKPDDQSLHSKYSKKTQHAHNSDVLGLKHLSAWPAVLGRTGSGRTDEDMNRREVERTWDRMS